MVRKLAAALAFVLFVPTLPALAADGEGKVSGVIKEIRADGKLVIEEQGPWKGPGTGLIARTLEIGPGTAIRVIRPTGTWDPKDANPGYDVEAADFRALKPGDFVTVTTGGTSPTAGAVDVMRGEGGVGMASPPTESLVTK
jgi:hypothetical protein